MKRIIYNSFLFAITIILISACTKEITADVKDLSGNPVINAFFRPDTNVSVQLTKSKAVLGASASNPYAVIPNATVKVFENGVEKLLTYDASVDRYVSDWIPHDGNSYSVSAIIPGIEKELLSPAQQVTMPISLTTFSTDTNTVNNKLYLQTKFTIDDQAGENYYHVIIKFRCKSNGMIVYEAPLYIDYEIMDPSGSNTGLNSMSNVDFQEVYTYGGFVFSDGEMEGKTIQFNLPSSIENMACNEGNEKELYVEVRRASKEYFQYVLTVSEFMDNNGNPFGTPVQVYNNIENGRGIWATYSKTSSTYGL